MVGPLTEAELGMKIRHPSIVRTYRCSCTEIEVIEFTIFSICKTACSD